MSRIGKKNILLPKEIKVFIKKSTITISGPKGALSYELSKMISIKQNDNELKLYLNDKTQVSRALYGLSRSIINNMVIGVSKGFNKTLEIQGVGYRCQMDGNNLILNIGYSHPVIIESTANLDITVEDSTKINISGIDKEKVGQLAAKIRSTRPPEPYKGKGIRYLNEQVKKKVGKAGK
uniref:Large ribosomal subunit protein uL6c n=2 Tax=Kappaphycus TaxID=38543 RepID=A0A2H4FG95_9FLOR|nr:50S ribosomal protein L6 [Kappaphycus striatus]